MLLELNGGIYQTTAEGAGFGMSTDDLKIWFGILALDLPIMETFKGVLRYLCAELIRVALLLALPVLTLALPRLFAG